MQPLVRTLDRRTFLQSTLTLGVGALLPSVLLAETVSHRASVVEFGADPRGEQDSTAAVRAAIASLPRRQARLVFPAGRYRFAASTDTAMQFSNFQGIEIYANNAELLFSGDTVPFGFRASKDVAVHDLKVDWERPAYSQGIVRQAGPQSFTIDIDEAFPVTGQEIITGFAAFEPSAAIPAPGAAHTRGITTTVSLVQPQRLRIGTSAAANVRPGMRLVLLHATGSMACFRIDGCENVLLEDVTIRHAPSTAFLVRGCRDLRLDSITVEPAASQRAASLLATGGDGLHCSNSHGKVELKEVRLSGIGGDAINIYQPYWRIAERPDDRTIIIEGPGGKPLQPWELPEAGDFVQFSRPSTLQLLGEIEITSLEAHPRGARLSLSETLSPVITTGALICGVVYAPRITIDQATIVNTLGRGLTVHARAEIKNSTFQNCRAEAIALAPDAQAWQGPGIQHVSIRANGFENCAIGETRTAAGDSAEHQGMISIDASRLRPAVNNPSDPGSKPPAINSGVRIQGNTFYWTNRTAIFADGVNDLVIDENILGHTSASQTSHIPLSGPANAQPSAIILRNVASAEVSNNVSDVALTIAMTDCADSVRTENNRLLTAAKLG
jgi:hypothetical protein